MLHDLLCWFGIHAWGTWGCWWDEEGARRDRKCRLCYHAQEQVKSQGRWRRVFMWLLFLTFGVATVASAHPLMQGDTQIRAVIGEAGASYEEMSAISHAIRNRGTLQGVYGLARVRWIDGDLMARSGSVWSPVSADRYHLASAAWFNSEVSKDPTDGADHWLSDWDLKNARKELTAFRFKMKETAYIGTTHFYRSKNAKANN